MTNEQARQKLVRADNHLLRLLEQGGHDGPAVQALQGARKAVKHAYNELWAERAEAVRS